MKQTEARVISNKMILPGGPHRAGQALASNLMWLHCPEIARKVKPGQFVMVRCADLPLPRPFSIHQVNEDNLALFFAVLEGGKGSQWMAQCQVGHTLKLMGPLGHGFTIYPDSKNLLLVAGGMGLAPLCFLAHQAVRESHSVTLLLGAAVSPLYSEQPGNLLPPEIKLVNVTEDGSVGRKGMITDLLPDLINSADQVFACGPLPMYKTIARMPELKDKPVQVSLEVRMGCGLGICYGCTVKTRNGLRQVCKDGPIFNLDEVLWEELADI